MEDRDAEFETRSFGIEIESENEVQEIGQNNTVITGVSAALVLLASLVVIYVSRKARTLIESRPAGILNPVIASVELELIEGQTETSEVRLHLCTNHRMVAQKVEQISRVFLYQTETFELRHLGYYCKMFK